MKSLYVVHFYGKVGGSGLGRQGLLLGFQENDLYYDDMSLMLFFYRLRMLYPSGLVLQRA